MLEGPYESDLRPWYWRAAGQGVATPGDIFALIFSRRPAPERVQRVSVDYPRRHTFLTIRTGVDPVESMGDGIDLLIPLNQDTMDRHLRLLTEAAPASITQTPSSRARPPLAYSFVRCRSARLPT